MSKRKKGIKWYEMDEASVAAMVKGVQLPLGSQSKKKKNPSKPYGEAELFENKVIEDELEERVEPSGVGDGTWVVVDPRSGAKHGPFASRDAARKAQRDLGITQKRDPTKSIEPPKKRPPAKHRKPTQGGPSFESLKLILKNLIKESSMISYMFEQAPPDGSLWENIVQKLPREVVMTDEGLYGMLTGIAKAEARVLARSVMEIKKTLEGAGPFMVERKEADQDPDSGDVRIPFTVSIGGDEMGRGDSELLFGIKLEGGKPLILFPEDSRNALNNMLTRESKLLRAELMHVQETILDSIDDVVQAGLQRDAYLNEMHARLKEVLGGMNLVETMLLKNLVREKLRGAK